MVRMTKMNASDSVFEIRLFISVGNGRWYDDAKSWGGEIVATNCPLKFGGPVTGAWSLQAAFLPRNFVLGAGWVRPAA